MRICSMCKREIKPRSHKHFVHLTDINLEVCKSCKGLWGDMTRNTYENTFLVAMKDLEHRTFFREDK